jgi:MerR family transcriptional regulator, light-induced transcriptional regulator
MADDDLLTTAEAARIARVGGSSVKRWADQRLLPCVRTAGGHRRFRRADLERFLANLGDHEVASGESWADLFLHATTHEVWGEIVAARGRAGAYYPIMEQVGRGLVEVGRRWERGEITILDEHAASEKLARALERTADGLGSDPTAPTAVVAVAEHDEHTLGLSLAEVVLREAGWNVRWAGRHTPTGELLTLVSQGSVELVALSASQASTESHRLASQLRALAPVCKQEGVHLVLGGSGAWPDPPEYGALVRNLETLHALAEKLRRELAVT